MKKVLNTLENASPGPGVVEWLNTITDPSFGLINSLVKNFLEKINDADFSKEVLIIIRQLNQHVEDKVHPQLMENLDFPRAITEYICITESERIPGDAYVLLV